MRSWVLRKEVIIDLIALGILILGSFFFAQKNIDFTNKPYEDAAILMRYAKNLGDGYGIVWNVGEKPTDGGTDFLFMVVIAGLYKSGIVLENSVRVIDFFSHFLNLFLIYFASRRIMKAPPVAAFISASFFIVGPGLFYTAAYFGTPFFALFACISWILALKIMEGKTDHVYSCIFAISCLTTGLIRPEGVILASLMMLSIIVNLGIKRSFNPLVWFLSIFILLGGTYFLWRWNYFGFPLPNPYYKKGGGFLYLSSLRSSIKWVVFFGLPFWPMYLAGFRNKKLCKIALSYLLPIFGFSMIFVLLSTEMNFAARFQYAVLSIIFISWYPFVKDLQQKINDKFLITYPIIMRIGISLLFVILFFILINNQIQNLKKIAVLSKDGRFDIALYLNQYKRKGYWMATSEAGLLPLYSEWNTIDTWGLTNQWIAHNGIITKEYIDRYKPEVIIFHAFFSPADSNCTFQNPEWTSMVDVVNEYAKNNPYTLAAVFGVNPCDTHYYYVRNDFPDSSAIIDTIHNFNYSMIRSNLKCNNYAP